jgi:hypothetical protein
MKLYYSADFSGIFLPVPRGKEEKCGGEGLRFGQGEGTYSREKAQLDFLISLS